MWLHNFLKSNGFEMCNTWVMGHQTFSGSNQYHCIFRFKATRSWPFQDELHRLLQQNHINPRFLHPVLRGHKIHGADWVFWSWSIPTILRPYTKEQKSVEAAGATLSALITDLDAQYAGLGERLLEDGALRRFINIYINDEDVRFLGGLEAPLKDGDSVTILPAVAGGSVNSL